MTEWIIRTKQIEENQNGHFEGIRVGSNRRVIWDLFQMNNLPQYGPDRDLIVYGRRSYRSNHDNTLCFFIVSLHNNQFIGLARRIYDLDKNPVSSDHPKDMHWPILFLRPHNDVLMWPRDSHNYTTPPYERCLKSIWWAVNPCVPSSFPKKIQNFFYHL